MVKYLLTAVVTFVAVGTGLLVCYISWVPDMPQLDIEEWWGKGPKPKEEDTSIRHFTIDFNDTMVNDLRQRLRNRRPMTKPLEGIQSQYGINTIYLDEALKYWQDKYDFKKRAELLNKFPHYKTRIQGLDIHFIRVRPEVKPSSNVKVLPLLMLHGWPSSSKEFVKVIPMLTNVKKDYNFVFEVIAADLPGFGFSEGTTKPGLSPVAIGIVMRNLMKRLGFDKFYVQAGDWGSQCATHMVTIFPDEILGFHTNMPISSRAISNVKLLVGSLYPSFVDRKHHERIYPLRDTFSYLMKEFGYFHLQATKPDTIGTALNDSPTSLAAYIMEKMAVCAGKQLDTLHGGLENLNMDDVLDTLTIMWANQAVTTSIRLYAEGFGVNNAKLKTLHNIPTPVPTAAVKFLHEVYYQPDWLLQDKFPNLVRSSVYDFGGHFAALQTPQVFVDDLFDATVEFLKFNSQKK